MRLPWAVNKGFAKSTPGSAGRTVPGMRLLRLTSSDERQDHLPFEERAGTVGAKRLADRLGEPIDFEARVLWPTERMPEMVAKWVTEYGPDFVLVRIPSYWVTYESVPLKLRRRFGKAGERLADVGKASARMKWLAERGAYHAARRGVLRSIGGATPFTTAEVIPRLEAALRSILKDESVGIVVRGPITPHNTIGTRTGARRATRRMAELDQAAAALCGRLRIPYVSVADREAAKDPALFTGDRLHRNAMGQARVADWETEAIAEVWERQGNHIPLA